MDPNFIPLNTDLKSTYQMLSNEDLESHLIAAEDVRNPGRVTLTENQRTLRDLYAKAPSEVFQEHYNALLAVETVRDLPPTSEPEQSGMTNLITNLQELIKALEEADYSTPNSKPEPCQYARVSPPFPVERAESIDTWFGRLARSLVNGATSARKRFQFYQFFGSEPGSWAFLPIPNCEVTRDGSVYAKFRYWLNVGWLFWSVTFCFGRASKPLAEAKGYPHVDQEYYPDEANERP